jgi:plasmid stabilization system protein ParE
VKFVIRPAAREDILRQYRYYLIEAEDERVAERFLESVQLAIAQGCKHPGIGAPKMLNNLKLAGLRSWPVKGFSEMRIYFLVSEKALRIVRVLHSRRDINPMLETDEETE